MEVSFQGNNFETAIPPDLILIGEFSEVEGPVPLLTIPKILVPLPYRRSNSRTDHNQIKVCPHCSVCLNKPENQTNFGAPALSQDDEVCVLDQDLSDLNSYSTNCSCSLLLLLKQIKEKHSSLQHPHCDTFNSYLENNKNSLDNRLEGARENYHSVPQPSSRVSSSFGINNCDISIEKHSDSDQFFSCAAHGRRYSHICSCPTPTSLPSSSHLLNDNYYRQNPMYHGVNLNDLILKLMSTDYQNYG